MKLKLLPYVLFAVSALAFFAMVSNRSSSSGSLRGLQSTNSDDVSAVNSVLPLTFTISGVSQLVQALVEASAISNSTFDTISVNALSSSVNGDIIDYELALSLTNDENVTSDGYIQGVYNSTSGNIDFTTASYNLSAVESDSSDVSEEVSEEVSEVEESSDAENATEVLLSNYTSISASQVSQDAIALAAVKYGSRNVLANLINEGDIPALAPSYSINPIVSAGYKNQSDANYYLFSVHMINAAYINVNTTFVVSYNGNYSLKYFTYLAYNYTAAQFNMTSLPTTTANTTSNVTSNGTVVDPNNVSGNTNVTIGVSVGNTTNVTAPANTTNSTAPSSNTTVAANATSSTANTTAATWTAIDTSKISSNTKALGGLKYGAKTVLSNIINSGKIPAYYPNYSISKINSAAYQNQINNVTLYKYNVSMVNAAYIHVNSTFTVAYNGNNGNYTLKNYTWTAYNYTQAEFNMTTPTSTTTTANTTTTTTPSVNSTSTSTANNTSSSSTGTGSGATTLPASESESVSEDSDITPGIMLGSDTAVF